MFLAGLLAFGMVFIGAAFETIEALRFLLAARAKWQRTSHGGCGRDDRSDHWKCYRSETQRAHHVSSRHSRKAGWHLQWLVKQLKLLQLLQRQPNKFIVYVRAGFGS